MGITSSRKPALILHSQSSSVLRELPNFPTSWLFRRWEPLWLTWVLDGDFSGPQTLVRPPQPPGTEGSAPHSLTSFLEEHPGGKLGLIVPTMVHFGSSSLHHCDILKEGTLCPPVFGLPHRDDACSMAGAQAGTCGWVEPVTLSLSPVMSSSVWFLLPSWLVKALLLPNEAPPCPPCTRGQRSPPALPM